MRYPFPSCWTSPPHAWQYIVSSITVWFIWPLIHSDMVCYFHYLHVGRLHLMPGQWSHILLREEAHNAVQRSIQPACTTVMYSTGVKWFLKGITIALKQKKKVWGGNTRAHTRTRTHTRTHAPPPPTHTHTNTANAAEGSASKEAEK